MNKQKIKDHLDILATKDKHLASVLETVGYPSPRVRPVGFETFLTTIISQQISNRAAATISARVLGLMPEISPSQLLALSYEDLRSAGMSHRKIEYAQSLASAIKDRDFEPDKLPYMDDQTAIDYIVQLRGFGVWSAEIYLMFSLGREDIFPADDLIIRQALKLLKRRRSEVTAKQARLIVRHWSPYRSAASLLLWSMHHHGMLKANK